MATTDAQLPFMPQAASCVAFWLLFILLLFIVGSSPNGTVLLLLLAVMVSHISTLWLQAAARNRFGQWEPLLVGSEVFEP